MAAQYVDLHGHTCFFILPWSNAVPTRGTASSTLLYPPLPSSTLLYPPLHTSTLLYPPQPSSTLPAHQGCQPTGSLLEPYSTIPEASRTCPCPPGLRIPLSKKNYRYRESGKVKDCGMARVGEWGNDGMDDTTAILISCSLLLPVRRCFHVTIAVLKSEIL